MPKSEFPRRKAAGKIRLGVSSCLLGEEVRYDGGHKHNALVAGMLGEFFEWVGVCPELEMGLGVPRETLRLVGNPEDPSLLTLKSELDHTKGMRRYARRRLQELALDRLRGYILKKDSPSCGLFRVRVYFESGAPSRNGRGLFASALAQRFPLLPLEEEGRLNDMPLRENFIERVYGFHRWMELRSCSPRPGDLVNFHARHKFTLLSHSRARYNKLGRLVARAGKDSFPALLEEYGKLFMQALACKATRKKHTDVLHHLAGYLKKVLDRTDKEELVEAIEDYHQEAVPLIVPITLLKHHFRRHPDAYVLGQTYLNPYPAELMLRNHV